MSQLNFQSLADSLSQKPLTSSRTPVRTPQRDSAGHVLSHFSGHTIQRHLSSRVSPATVLVTAGHHYTVARGCHLAFTTLLTCHVTQAFVTAVANTCTVWNNNTQRARTLPAQPKCRDMRTRVATERFSEQAHVTDCHDKTAPYFRKSFYVMQSCYLDTSPKFLT